MFCCRIKNLIFTLIKNKYQNKVFLNKKIINKLKFQLLNPKTIKKKNKKRQIIAKNILDTE